MSRPPKPYRFKVRGGIYYVIFHPVSQVPPSLCGREYSTGERTPGRAQTVAVRKYHELLKDAPQAQETLTEYASVFYTDRCPHCRRVGVGKVRDSTMRNRRQVIHRHIERSALGEKRLEAITVTDLADFRHELLKTLAVSSARRVMSVLRTILTEAEIQDRITKNPARKLPRLPRQYAERGTFSRPELRHLLRREHWKFDDAYIIFRVAAVLGLRSGEVRALRFSDFRDGCVTIERSVDNAGVIGPTKTGRPRTIPIPEFLSAEIAAHRSPGDYLACDLDNRPRSTRWWMKHYEAALSRSGVPPVSDGRKRTPHSLRHTLSTELLSSGISPAIVGSFLGHETGLSLVQQAYTHLQADHLRSILPVLCAIFCDAERA